MNYIDCGTLIDGTGAAPIDDGRILIEDGRIVDAGPAESVRIPDDAEHIDHTDATVLPGLIDAHLHLKGTRSMDPFDHLQTATELATARATADVRTLLEAGFTAIRDVGSEAGLPVRQAIDDGTIPGPRVFTSGSSFSQTAGHGDRHYLPTDWATSDDAGGSQIVDGADECRKGARERIREGADLLKIMTTGGVLSEKDAPSQSQFTDAEIQAFTEEAHRVGIPVAAHAQGAPGIKSALRNGVDTIEHGFYIDQECLDLFAETGATFVPTLSIMHRLIERGDEFGVPEYGLEKARNASEAHFDATRRAYEAGVPIALGTDFLGPAPMAHGENALEAELLVEEIGMTEHEAIVAGTGTAAETVPADDIGTLEAGNYADLVAFAESPLVDITNLYEPSAVYKGGERVEL